MSELIDIPVLSATLFFLSGLIFGTFFRTKSDRTSKTITLSKLERLRFAWKQRKSQVKDLQRGQSLIPQLNRDLEKAKTEISTRRSQLESIQSSLKQLEFDYFEQKERLHRQLRRNRMLNTQLSEVIEAKAKLAALHLSNHVEDKNSNSSKIENKRRFQSNISNQPLIISDRVKLRVPRKVEEENKA